MIASDESVCHDEKINNISSFCALHLLAGFFCLVQTVQKAAFLARKFQLCLLDILSLKPAHNYLLSQKPRALSRWFLKPNT